MTTNKPDSIRGRVDGAARCPRCPTSPLKRIGAVSACVKCGGVFVPASERDAMAEALQDMADTAQLVAQHAPRPVDATQTAASARCPVCLEEMQRFRIDGDGIPGGAFIEVDSCLAHGAFYDRGELIAVQRAFAAGAQALDATSSAASSASSSASDSLELARAPRSAPHVPRTEYEQVAPPADIGMGVGDDERRARAELDRLRNELRIAERDAQRDPKRRDSTGHRVQRLAMKKEIRARERALGVGFTMGGPLISADTSAEGLILSELSTIPGDIIGGVVAVLDILSIFKR
jgi:hypothetical protein